MRNKEEQALETIKQLAALLKTLSDVYGMNMEKDNTGQVVIYTGLAEDENGYLLPWTEKNDNI